MPLITVKDGTQIFYKDWGVGAPVVFSHGWPLSSDSFSSAGQIDGRPQASAGSKTGESPWPGDPERRLGISDWSGMLVE